ncbi:hypothetical protein PV416_08090 [Streptomyces ipomoeae]|uniref:hypothetical protein n=1 Tax=Streptomyces ipomoeae TaxID=103232 RepID=UPI0029B9EFB9|nr:hypothetical protein [Streptomyces ipomoeae]MDX2821050.1 hypothetical protein [Streptomyces ipomoeae]MDX2876402.1 hypothetical protein [Streptomyces ipomoeae]
MSVRDKPCTQDGRLREVFGAPVADLYETAAGPDASAALTRALEIRSFLALAEEQVARICKRVHEAMRPEHDMDELSADQLRMDAQWLEAALSARDGYRTALGDLLRTMPPPGQQTRPVRMPQQTITTTLPPATAAPAPQRAGAARERRP